MPKSKGWKRDTVSVKKGNQRASREVSIEGKNDFDLCPPQPKGEDILFLVRIPSASASA